MEKVTKEIEEIVNRETRAWDTKDVDLLLTIFHPDFVWPFPRTPHSHDPIEWYFVLGRYDPQRWKKFYQEFFDTHSLTHNIREIIKTEISKEGDGAFAVVDTNTAGTVTNQYGGASTATLPGMAHTIIGTIARTYSASGFALINTCLE